MCTIAIRSDPSVVCMFPPTTINRTRLSSRPPRARGSGDIWPGGRPEGAGIMRKVIVSVGVLLTVVGVFMAPSLAGAHVTAPTGVVVTSRTNTSVSLDWAQDYV